MPRLATAVPAALVVLSLLSITWSAAPPHATAKPADEASADLSKAPLWELMELMGDELRKAKALLRKDNKFAEAADHIHQMQVLAIEGKLRKPPILEETKDEEKRAELAAGYRRSMIQLTQRLLELETAILDEKKDEAFKLIDQLVEERFQAHLKYKTK